MAFATVKWLVSKHAGSSLLWPGRSGLVVLGGESESCRQSPQTGLVPVTIADVGNNCSTFQGELFVIGCCITADEPGEPVRTCGRGSYRLTDCWFVFALLCFALHRCVFGRASSVIHSQSVLQRQYEATNLFGGYLCILAGMLPKCSDSLQSGGGVKAGVKYGVRGQWYGL